MSDEERLGSECVWLYVDICSRNVLEKAGLSNIGVSADKKCPGVWVDGWQTAQVLSDLLEVKEWVFQALADCGHTTKCRPFEMLALEQRLTILQQSNVVS